jgi:hypothetical protein
MGWVSMAVWGFITNSAPLITKETANSANSHYSYSSDKIRNAINYCFIPIEESIRHTGKIFLDSINHQKVHYE